MQLTRVISTMGKHKKRHERKRARSSSSDSSSAGTPAPQPPGNRKKVSGNNNPGTVSTNTTNLHSMIPEFDPLSDNVVSWLNVIESYSSTFSWNDSMIRYQALNKLKGSAKIWYDSLLRNDHNWTKWTWKDWKQQIMTTFQVKRNMFELLKEIIENKPYDNQSLYTFFFEQKSKLDSLRLNFTEYDLISIILGNIGDDNISASVEASNFQTCNSLATLLHGRVYKSTVSLDKHTKSKVLSSIQSSETQSSEMISSETRKPFHNTNNVSLGGNSFTCYKCGGNHKVANCTIKCEFCGKRGHTEKVCFQKKKRVDKNVAGQEEKKY